MSEKTLKEALDDWGKQADKLVEETKKVGASASKELERQYQRLQAEGEKLADSMKRARANDKLVPDLERRYNLTRDKLQRAWGELKK